ncbi:carboxymuconolactone decarboxylase family protein [Campylobacter curvus]|uniref:carboxymuconolactone decarboxylase family protein n=1 Tax=Campylobacter curvus TaxID=200 RepID=UPI00146FF993|nr:carboxymuconolactone decarboxylase family protein [Campylobacter curvus]
MKLTKKASEFYDSWLGGAHPLEATDPEFTEIYLNFLFDDVSSEINLSTHERLKITLACLAVIGAKRAYGKLVTAALKNGVKAGEIREILYQAVPYAGFGRLEEMFYAMNEAFKEAGVALPLAGAGTTTRENREAKGLAVQKEIFPAIDKFNADASEDERHIRRFLSAHCFGDFYTREGLELKFRELLTFVYVLSLGYAKPQLLGHIAGNFHIGNDRAKLIDVTTALVPFIGYPMVLNAFAAIDEVSKKG